MSIKKEPYILFMIGLSA